MKTMSARGFLAVLLAVATAGGFLACGTDDSGGGCPPKGCGGGAIDTDAWVPFPDGDLSLYSDGPAAAASFGVTVAPSVLHVPAGASAPLAVTATRDPTFAGVLTVGAAGLPAGVSASSLVLEPDASVGTLSVTAALDASIATADASVAATTLVGPNVIGFASAPFTLAVDPPSGTRDTTFGDAGLVGAPLGATVVGAAGLGSQAILVVGNATNLTRYAPVSSRFAANGALDITYGTAGTAGGNLAGPNLAGADVVIAPDGSFVVAGQSQNPYHFFVARYGANGALDTSFASGTGVAYPAITGETQSQAKAIALTADGKIVAAGSSLDGTGRTGVAVVRLTASGTPDATFGTAGAILPPYSATYETATAVAVQSDGAVLVGIYSDHVWTLARYTPAGLLDATFGAKGRVSLASVGSAFTRAIAVQPDGRIVAVAEVSSSSGGYDAVVARLLPSGALDPSFGSNGLATLRAGDGASSIDFLGLTLDDRGRITLAGNLLSAGATAASVAIARLDASGALDATFGSSGLFVIQPHAGVAAGARSVWYGPNGHLYVAGAEQGSVISAPIFLLELWP